MQLRIDGQTQDVSRVWVHHQSDPYPGGHQFELILSKDEAESLFDELTSEDLDALKDKGRHILSLVSDEFFNDTSDFEFVLNTVEKLEMGNKDVKITGICSPLLRYSDGIGNAV